LTGQIAFYGQTKQDEGTREQAETKKEQAATLMERIGDPERADEYRDMSVEEYAEGRGLSLTNPRREQS
jgi:hypothetical protein